MRGTEAHDLSSLLIRVVSVLYWSAWNEAKASETIIVMSLFSVNYKNGMKFAC